MSVRIVKTRNLRTKHHLKRSNTIKYHRYLATLSNTLLNSVMPGNDLSVFNIFTYFAFLQQLGGRACGAYKPKTHKPAVVGLKRALSAKQSISKRSRYPLNFVSVYLLIGDLEHLMGTPVFFLLEHVRTIRKGSLFFLLKLFFDGQFFWKLRFLRISTKMSFHVLFFAGLSGDLDLLLDYQCMCFDKTHFPNVNRLYGNFSKMISFMWGFYVRYCGGVGFIYQMSGKFSRHLLTQARTRTTRLGKTSFAIVDHNIIYRYGQTHSETGAYGINLFFFTQNRFKLKSKHP